VFYRARRGYDTLARMTREQRDFLRNEIDALIRERLAEEPTRRGPRQRGGVPQKPRKVKERL